METEALLNISEIARRWKCDRKRVRALIDGGFIAALQLPAAGEFDPSVRVLLSEVERCEREWETIQKPSRRGKKSLPASVNKYFPD